MNQDRFRDMLRDERGTATMETLVILPLIAICWAGVFFFFAGYEARITAATAARREAWITSNDACKGHSPEADCSAERKAGPLDDSETGSNVTHNPSAANGDTGWIEAAMKVPFLGPIIGSVFGTTAVVTEHNTFERPPLVGGGEMEARYAYRISCNVEPRSEEQLVVDVFCGMLRSIGMPIFCGEGPKGECQ